MGKTMPKQVEVIVEGFGNKRLSKVLSVDEVRGKSIDDQVRMILGGEWQGENRVSQVAIQRKLETTGGQYLPSVARGGVELGRPVEFLPVQPYTKTDEYIQPTRNPTDQLRIAIVPAHKVAYSI